MQWEFVSEEAAKVLVARPPGVINEPRKRGTFFAQLFDACRAGKVVDGKWLVVEFQAL